MEENIKAPKAKRGLFSRKKQQEELTAEPVRPEKPPKEPKPVKRRTAPVTFPPMVGCIVLAVVAFVLFLIFYLRLSPVWAGETSKDLIWLAVICGVCCMASMVLLEIYLYFEKRSVLTDPKKLFAIVSLLVLSTALTAVTTLVSFAFVAAFIAIILCGLLVSQRSAYTMALLMAGMCLLMTATKTGPGALDDPIAVALAVFFGGTVAALMLHGKSGRIEPIISGAVGGVVAAIVLFAVEAFNGGSLKPMLSSAAWMFGGSLLSGILATGLLPAFERIFDICTDARLNELMNNNNPLLKRLMLEAPGTYHHSLIVAVLAEAAAELVGANTLLCKTAAYYHDVCKLTSPRYFKENQGEYNIHDELPPEESAARILAHPKDSEEMLIRANFPSEIVRMAGQHHGDSLVYYFYSKARERAIDPDTVNIADYRYDSPKPTTKEEAVLMLADCCEAAVRAIKRPTPEMIEERVKSVISGMWNPADSQLSQCPLTARDIRVIEASFIKNLLAQYHERIEYPQDTPVLQSPGLAETLATAPIQNAVLQQPELQ